VTASLIAFAATISAVLVVSRRWERGVSDRLLAWTAVAAALVAATVTAVAHLGPGTAFFLGIAAGAAVWDAAFGVIPNVLSVAATSAAVLVWLQAGATLWPLVVAVLCGALLLVAWWMGALGGGDVKFVPALVLAGGAVVPAATVPVGFIVLGVLALVSIPWALAAPDRTAPWATAGFISVSGVIAVAL